MCCNFIGLFTTLQQLIDLISSDELDFRTEDRVFNAVMTSIDHDEQQRRQFISKVCCNSITVYRIRIFVFSDAETC